MCSYSLIYFCLRPLLFLIDPEKSHDVTLKLLKWLCCPWLAKQRIEHFPKRPTTLFGLTFPNPVGLAAGLDKNGSCIDALLGLGFGFVEVGAVTPKPQAGNAKPRLFRIPQAQALINRMGFNNEGVDQLIVRLQKRKVKGIVGVNIGKNAATPLDQAVEDYRLCYEKLYPYVDFVTINISSPNTPQLRELHADTYLNDLLQTLKTEQHHLTRQQQRRVPLLLKISPDLTDAQLEAVSQIALIHQIDGIIAVNTTQSRDTITGLRHAEESGGLSGKPLFSKTIKIVKQLAHFLDKKIPIIAVGGIMSPEDALALFAAGAKLVQIYTGLVYQGPGLIRHIILKLKQQER